MGLANRGEVSFELAEPPAAALARVVAALDERGVRTAHPGPCAWGLRFGNRGAQFIALGDLSSDAFLFLFGRALRRVPAKLVEPTDGEARVAPSDTPGHSVVTVSSSPLADRYAARFLLEQVEEAVDVWRTQSLVGWVGDPVAPDASAWLARHKERKRLAR